MKTSIPALVRDAEERYTSGPIKKGKYVEYDMHEIINVTDAYLNSQHIFGKYDSLGREKPFFNIVSAAVNIWYRATDIDRKDIRILPSKSEETALVFIANVLLKQWMIKERLGVFLNSWGRRLAQYGSAIVEFIEQDGRLIPSVLSWNDTIVDPIKFSSLPVIKKLYFTPEELIQHKGYDSDVVSSLIGGYQSRKNLDDQTVDNRSDFIEVYEVHGMLSKAIYNNAKGLKVKDGDENIFFEQMHTVSFLKKEEGYDEFTLYCGRENKSPHLLTHLIEEDGRTLSIGAVEYLFDAQWMVNHTMKQTRDYLDLSSKMIFQTSDTNFIGRNVLKAIENGQILIHKQGMPLTQINNTAINITALISFKQQWEQLGQSITNTPDASRAITPPSGTPYSTVATLVQQAGSLFEVMIENKGLHIEEMLRVHIIPFLKKQMDTSEEIAAILDEEQIQELDAMYVPREAIRRFNQKTVEKVLALDIDKPLADQSIPSPFQADIEHAQVRDELAMQGNQRFFKPSDIKTKTWKKLLDGFEWNVHVETGNTEFQDTRVLLQTLSQMLRDILQTGGAILQNPIAKQIYSKIMNMAGSMSPLQLSSSQTSSIAPSASTPLEPPQNGGEPTPLPAIA